MATSLHGALKSALLAARPIRLLAQEVERADAAALQVLASFVSAAQVRRLPVAWHEPTKALRRAAQLAGLAGALNFPATD
jgi:ABC-type transporter Mla MlaB component